MDSTTVRVDINTHARLVALSEAAGTSLIETVSDAAEALVRQRFAHKVAAELVDLRDDKQAWAAYVADADATSVRDGVG